MVSRLDFLREIITMRKHCGQEETAGLRLLFQKIIEILELPKGDSLREFFY